MMHTVSFHAGDNYLGAGLGQEDECLVCSDQQ